MLLPFVISTGCFVLVGKQANVNDLVAIADLCRILAAFLMPINADAS